MSKANQHFVPRVYLKRWSPNEKENVFIYNKNNLDLCELRNVRTILYHKHTYTIKFEDRFVLKSMPEVNKDFAEQTMNILDRYSAKAYNNGKIIKNHKLCLHTKHYDNLDNWIFKRKDNTNELAPQKAIISTIKQINSYKLETALDDFFEKKWNYILDSFILEVEEAHKYATKIDEVYINPNTAENIILTLLIFICRNPRFDFNGILPQIHQLLLKIFLHSNNNDEKAGDDIEEIEAYIQQQIRAVKLTEVYKALFNNNSGFFKFAYDTIKTTCQIKVLRVSIKNGSFITSDNPAFSYISKLTAENNNAIYFPISPQYMIMIGKGEQNSLSKILIQTITNRELQKYNNIILNNSTENIISNCKHLGYFL